MRHRAGLSQLNGASKADLMDHLLMEERMAAAPMGLLKGRPAYHALTYGWLMSGLARAVTGRGMRELFRTELAAPLNTDGFHLGRPPVGAPTQPAQIIGPQTAAFQNPIFNAVAPHVAALPLSGDLRVDVLPGDEGDRAGRHSAARRRAPGRQRAWRPRVALARMYGAIANGGVIDGTQFLSAETVAGLTGRPSFHPDGNMVMPMSFHLGYHSLPLGGMLPGFGHVGLGGSLGWADPRARPGVRLRPQPPAHAAGGGRSGRLRGDRGPDPTWCGQRAQARIRAGEGIRRAIHRARQSGGLNHSALSRRTRSSTARRDDSALGANASDACGAPGYTCSSTETPASARRSAYVMTSWRNTSSSPTSR